jgi:hypothetical protein
VVVLGAEALTLGVAAVFAVDLVTDVAPFFAVRVVVRLAAVFVAVLLTVAFLVSSFGRAVMTRAPG